ncbi:PilZ domain-containing protein [Geothermobacter ehrlichii]|uniref:PilZ domain-containing protein n=1 Tax=Geothermobacter ehrlichii TaxID=213224 RepID=A0A5D3WNN6_9BACT|nr:PilZ domain-containing protein [Geothermobacter ehrlichii]TYP00168.1 PilZ domain-containing protein [Geothermobacter ehrlichii]
MKDLASDLQEGSLLSVTIPIARGNRVTLDGAVEETADPLIIRIQKTDENEPAIDDHQEWVLTQELGDRVHLYHAGLVRILGPRRYALTLRDRQTHKSTRKSCRIQARVRIREWTGHSAWSRLRKAKPRQVTLSTSGICFLTDDHFHPGQKVNLEISLPGHAFRPVQVTGQIIRALPKGAGKQEIAVAFLNLSSEDSDIIETFFIREQFRVMTDRIRLLGEALSPSLTEKENGGKT